MSFYIGKIRIPVIQPNFEITGDRKVEQVDILNSKTATFMGNQGLLNISYSSFFPSNYGYYCDVSSGNLKKPIKYVKLLEKIRDGSNFCRVRITEKKINKMCYIKSFSWSDDGRLGDIKYSITLEEYVKPTQITKIPTTSTTTTSTEVTSFNNSLQGEQRESKEVDAQEYTVKTGDCLYAIAKKFNMQWSTIYEDNKSTIGNDPNLIYAGQVLKIRGTKTTTDKRIVTLGSGRTITVG